MLISHDTPTSISLGLIFYLLKIFSHQCYDLLPGLVSFCVCI